MTDPKKILPLIKFISSALELGLLTKDEVIDWADKIVTEEDAPDISFIDLLLSNAKDTIFILSLLDDMMAFENIKAAGRPILAQLNKSFNEGRFDLAKTVKTLYRLKFHGNFNDQEVYCIIELDHKYYLANHNLHGSIDNVSKALTAFLNIYGGYSLFNYDEWVNLDKEVDTKLQLLDFDSLI